MCDPELSTANTGETRTSDNIAWYFVTSRRLHIALVTKRIFILEIQLFYGSCFDSHNWKQNQFAWFSHNLCSLSFCETTSVTIFTRNHSPNHKNKKHDQECDKTSLFSTRILCTFWWYSQTVLSYFQVNYGSRNLCFLYLTFCVKKSLVAVRRKTNLQFSKSG